MNQYLKVLTVLLTVFLLSFAIHYADCARFTIVPSVDTPCPGEFTGESCITLQQYIANPSSSDVTLELQPGNHQLDSQLTASSISSFTMIANTTATVTCNQQLFEASYLWLNLNQVETIHIGGITFSGCKLLVRQANNASLVKTSFIDKGGCCYPGVVELSQSSGRLDQCMFINNTGSFSAVVNGANSNLVITSSTFMDNYFSDRIGGANGGAIRAQNGQLTIINSSFVNNRASTRGNGGAVHVNSGGNLMIAKSYFITIQLNQMAMVVLSIFSVGI